MKFEIIQIMRVGRHEKSYNVTDISQAARQLYPAWKDKVFFRWILHHWTYRMHIRQITRVYP